MQEEAELEAEVLRQVCRSNDPLRTFAGLSNSTDGHHHTFEVI